MCLPKLSACATLGCTGGSVADWRVLSSRSNCCLHASSIAGRILAKSPVPRTAPSNPLLPFWLTTCWRDADNCSRTFAPSEARDRFLASICFLFQLSQILAMSGRRSASGCLQLSSKSFCKSFSKSSPP